MTVTGQGFGQLLRLLLRERRLGSCSALATALLLLLLVGHQRPIGGPGPEPASAASTAPAEVGPASGPSQRHARAGAGALLRPLQEQLPRVLPFHRSVASRGLPLPRAPTD